MANVKKTDKPILVEALSGLTVSKGEFQNCWGFRFEATAKDGRTRLTATLSPDDAAAFIEAGRGVKG